MITERGLQAVLIKHKKWLNEEAGGEPADLRGEYLPKIDLSYADLRQADLRDINLSQAKLQYADLRGARLGGAILKKANLQDANLNYACLYQAHLYQADLLRTNLQGADLRQAILTAASAYYTNLQDANLTAADLRWASFYYADLSNATLINTTLDFALFCKASFYKANLTGASLNSTGLFDIKDLHTVQSTRYTAMFLPVCPSEGPFIGWKRIGDYILKLLIPSDAQRLSGTSRQCRCSKAEVLAIQNIDGTDAGVSSVRSRFDYEFIYKVGQMAEVSDFDPNRWNECTTGIHFFITREEAEQYSI